MSSPLFPDQVRAADTHMYPVRHVWYQSQHEVVVDLLIKRVRARDVVTDVQPQAVTLDFRVPGGSMTCFRFEHLKHEILPTKSTIAVLPTRIEIRLRKKEPGIKWASIEAKDELAAEKAKAIQEAYIEEMNESASAPMCDPVGIQLMSDVHLEFHLRQANGHSAPGYSVFDFPVAAPNLALLGNVGLTTQPGLFDFFLRQLRRYERIFFIMGNHEGYNSTYDVARDKIREFVSWTDECRAAGENLGNFIFMDRTRYDVSDRLTILGCTLWSYVPSSHAAEVMRAGLDDFRRVNNWSTEDYRSAHLADVEWLNETCRHVRENEPEREVIIFTHHGPTTKGTLKPEHENTELSCTFVTEMSLQPCWAKPLKLWAFGHTHKCVDFLRDGVRVVSNQRGYEGFEAAKSKFQPQKVIIV